MLTALRSGSFVTRERMRVYSLLLLVAYVATIVVLLATARGIVDTVGRPIGTDFANVYAAGRLTLAGQTPICTGAVQDPWAAAAAGGSTVAAVGVITTSALSEAPALSVTVSRSVATPHEGTVRVAVGELAPVICTGRPSTWDQA